MILIFFLTVNQLNAFAQDDSQCLVCHEGLGASLMNTPHELGVFDDSGKLMKSACVDCHEGWKEHLEDPSAENITKAAEVSPALQAKLCANCHNTPHQASIASDDVHAKAYLACASCHTIHDNYNESLVKEDLDNFCLSCHSSTAMEFQQRSVHPLESGNVRCVSCHDLSSIGVAEFKIGFDTGCQSCHDEKSGPFLYEHAATYNHLVEAGSCIECHEPHGSMNDRLLKTPDNTLCMQCHEAPLGHLTAHSGLGVRHNCVECHSDIHGSYDNRLLLDPDLGSKFFPDCYQSGCHSVGN